MGNICDKLGFGAFVLNRLDNGTLQCAALLIKRIGEDFKTLRQALQIHFNRCAGLGAGNDFIKLAHVF